MSGSAVTRRGLLHGLMMQLLACKAKLPTEPPLSPAVHGGWRLLLLAKDGPVPER